MGGPNKLYLMQLFSYQDFLINQLSKFLRLWTKQPSTNKGLHLWRQSLPVNGGSLFNCLPQHIRDIKDVSVDCFKENLDKFLETVPDCPKTQYLNPAPINPVSGKNSNCLMDWINYIGRNRGYMGDILNSVNNN